MKNLKRFAALGLTFTMALSMAACGSGDAEKNSEVSKSTENTQTNSSVSTSKGETTETPVITFWVPESEGLDWDTCSTTLFLEEKFNVDMQFQILSSAEDGNTAYNLMLASKEDVPDVLLCTIDTTEQIVAGAEAGLLLPITDYIVEGTTYYDRLQEDPLWEKTVTANDGNIYTFIYSDVGAHNVCFSKMWYRAEWMDKLGWEKVPSTPEEFKQYLIDIRDNDVNGNGDPNDEIPLMGFYNGRMSDPVCFLMNPFELYVPDYYYITDDGEIKFTANTDGWRKGLAYVADLYAEGLIAEETYVQDNATFKAVLNKTPEEAVIGTVPLWRVAGDLDMSIEGNDFLTYQAFAPLKGDYQQAYCRPVTMLPTGAITTACENPELAFQIMDYLISDEGSLLTTYGPEGANYEWVEEKSYLGTTPAINRFSTETETLRKHVWVNGCPKVDSEENRYGTVLDENNLANDQQWELLHFSKVYEPYYVNNNIPRITWASDDVMVQKGEMTTMINEYVQTANTEFVMGIRDINDDAQWEAYLKDLEKMGLNDYIELLYTFHGLK